MAKFKADAEKLSKFVAQSIKEEGFPSPHEVFTEDITTLSQDELLRYLATYTSFFASASVHEAKWASYVAALKRDLDNARANAFLLAEAKTVGERDRISEVDKDVVTILENLSLADTFLNAYTALKKGYEQYNFLFSRAITLLSEEKKLR